MTRRPEPPWTPVGIDGIAEQLGVTQDTVVTWRRRSAKEWVTVEKFPDPAGKISGRDWWWLADILDWARETGRLKGEQAGERLTPVSRTPQDGRGSRGRGGQKSGPDLHSTDPAD